jgi:hypothetical protein
MRDISQNEMFMPMTGMGSLDGIDFMKSEKLKLRRSSVSVMNDEEYRVMRAKIYSGEVGKRHSVQSPNGIST